MIGFEQELYRVGASVANQAAAVQKEELLNMSEKKQFKRGLPVEPMQPGDLADVIEIALKNVSKGGMPAAYECDNEGLQMFFDTSKNYFMSIAEQNRAAGDLSQMLIPSVEMWCAFLGISRQTLLTYQRRGEEWANTINFFKTVIYAAKNELANHGKLSPVLLIFDSVNNFDYRNVAEFKLEPVRYDEQEESNQRIKEIVRRLEAEKNQAQIEDKGTDTTPTQTLDDYLT